MLLHFQYKIKYRTNSEVMTVAPAIQPTLCGHLLWRFAIQQQSTAPQSGHALLTQVGSMYS